MSVNARSWIPAPLLLLHAAPSSGQLYGREDRSPVPSPNPGLDTQHAQPGAAFGGGDGGGSTAVSDELHMYPVHDDPSVQAGTGAGPRLSKEETLELENSASSPPNAPRAAGQGVVEQLGGRDCVPLP